MKREEAGTAAVMAIGRVLIVEDIDKMEKTPDINVVFRQLGREGLLSNGGSLGFYDTINS